MRPGHGLGSPPSVLSLRSCLPQSRPDLVQATLLVQDMLFTVLALKMLQLEGNTFRQACPRSLVVTT